MAKPTGALEIADFGFEQQNGAGDYLYVIHPLRIMPHRWRENFAGNVRDKITIDWFAYTADADNDAIVRAWWWNDDDTGQMIFLTSSATSPVWGVGDAPTTQSAYPVGQPINGVGFGTNTPLRAQCCELFVRAEDADNKNDVQIYGLCFEETHDVTDYDDAGEDWERFVHVIDRTTANSIAYSAQRPACSWLVADACGATLNVLTFEATYQITIPLFSDHA